MLNKLFNKLNQANQALQTGQSSTIFLDQSIDGGYLYTLHLTGVDNPLKPKPLWLAEHTAGGNTIRNKEQAMQISGCGRLYSITVMWRLVKIHNLVNS